MNTLSRFFLLLAIVLSSTASVADEVVIDNSTFDCIRDMTPVRGFFVDNLKGNLEATVKVSQAGEGTYPPGSVVQLVPGEAMIKRAPGFSPATSDWEFFELDVTNEGSSIRARGFVDVVNRFDGNCFACHIKANPGRDMICESGHGCDPIPLTPLMVKAIQNTDPRCEPVPLPAEQIEALKQLKAVMAAPQE